MSAMDVEPALNVNLDAAKSLQTALNNAQLRITGDRDKFKAHKLEGMDELEGSDALSDPAVVADDVAAQVVS